jgi:hypothetical protein
LFSEPVVVRTDEVRWVKTNSENDQLTIRMTPCDTAAAAATIVGSITLAFVNPYCIVYGIKHSTYFALLSSFQVIASASNLGGVAWRGTTPLSVSSVLRYQTLILHSFVYSSHQVVASASNLGCVAWRGTSPLSVSTPLANERGEDVTYGDFDTYEASHRSFQCPDLNGRYGEDVDPNTIRRQWTATGDRTLFVECVMRQRRRRRQRRKGTNDDGDGDGDDDASSGGRDGGSGDGDGDIYEQCSSIPLDLEPQRDRNCTDAVPLFESGFCQCERGLWRVYVPPCERMLDADGFVFDNSFITDSVTAISAARSNFNFTRSVHVGFAAVDAAGARAAAIRKFNSEHHVYVHGDHANERRGEYAGRALDGEPLFHQTKPFTCSDVCASSAIESKKFEWPFTPPSVEKTKPESGSGDSSSLLTIYGSEFAADTRGVAVTIGHAFPRPRSNTTHAFPPSPRQLSSPPSSPTSSSSSSSSSSSLLPTQRHFCARSSSSDESANGDSVGDIDVFYGGEPISIDATRFNTDGDVTEDGTVAGVVDGAQDCCEWCDSYFAASCTAWRFYRKTGTCTLLRSKERGGHGEAGAANRNRKETTHARRGYTSGFLLTNECRIVEASSERIVCDTPSVGVRVLLSRFLLSFVCSLGSTSALVTFICALFCAAF